jgi:hypothetical protein
MFETAGLTDRTAVLVDQVEPQAELLIVGAVVATQKQEIRHLENQRIPAASRKNTVNAEPVAVDHSVRAGSGYITAQNKRLDFHETFLAMCVITKQTLSVPYDKPCGTD